MPNPEELVRSSTTLPDQTSSSASAAMATGCSIQCTRSVLVAWPQDPLPAVFPDGLCW